MKKNNPIVIGIDIGSSYIKAVACLYGDDIKYPLVLATYKEQIDGVIRGNVMSDKDVAKSLSLAVDSIEDEIGEKVKHILISVSGTEISSCHISSFTQVTKGDTSVTDLDIDNAIKEGKKVIPDAKNKTVIHHIPIRYKIDGNEITGDPIGMCGNRLEIKTLFVTCGNNAINSLKRAISASSIRVTDIVTGIIAESIPLLTKKQKMAGALLLNIGSQTTSILVYENNIPLLVSVLPIGGDDITKDIAIGMKVTIEEAEDIKCGSVEKVHSKRKVEEIIEARIEYLCDKINKELHKIGRSELLPAGVIVSGDSSKIERLDYMLRNGLKLPIKISKNELLKFSENNLTDTEWARAYGLCFLAPDDSEGAAIKEVLTNTANSVKKFFSQFLP